MNMVTLKFRNIEISLNCDDDDRLKLLASRFNKRVIDISNSFKNTSDLKLFIVAGLMIEDQLDNLLRKVEKDSKFFEHEISNMKKIYSETVLQMVDYVDNIANKLENG